MIKIGKVIGDVIEAGGVKNVTNNYYGEPTDESEGEGKSEDLQVSDDELPEVLRSEQAEELLEKLVDFGLLDDDWQPKALSQTERALVAKELSRRLHIDDLWQVFGRLWRSNPETLRAAFNKALDQKKSIRFQEKVKNILG